MKEELDCLVKVNKLITTIEHVYNTFSLTLNLYACELVDKEPTLIEHSDGRWCSREELKTLDFVEADYKFLDLI